MAEKVFQVYKEFRYHTDESISCPEVKYCSYEGTNQARRSGILSYSRLEELAENIVDVSLGSRENRFEVELQFQSLTIPTLLTHVRASFEVEKFGGDSIEFRVIRSLDENELTRLARLCVAYTEKKSPAIVPIELGLPGAKR